jgi:hypothetical protein
MHGSLPPSLPPSLGGQCARDLVFLSKSSRNEGKEIRREEQGDSAGDGEGRLDDRDTQCPESSAFTTKLNRFLKNTRNLRRI